MNLYAIALVAHSYVRWLVLLVAIVLLVRTLMGWLGGREWTGADNRLHGLLVGVVNLQFVLGALLYAWLSPVTYAFFGNMGGGMGEPMLRFFGIEHIVGMVVAITLIHIGRGRSQRKTGSARHKTVFITLLIAVLVMLVSIPWPARPYGRPLFRTLDI